MAIDDICDDRIFVLSPPGSKRMDAVGMRLSKENDTLVGIYSCWNEYQNPGDLITEVVKVFGKAQLYGNELFDKGMCPALICMFDSYMKTWQLPEADSRFDQLRMDITEIKASVPAVYLHLDYDRNADLWTAKPMPDLVLRGPGYEPLPNAVNRKTA